MERLTPSRITQPTPAVLKTGAWNWWFQAMQSASRNSSREAPRKTCHLRQTRPLPPSRQPARGSRETFPKARLQIRTLTKTARNTNIRRAALGGSPSYVRIRPAAEGYLNREIPVWDAHVQRKSLDENESELLALRTPRGRRNALSIIWRRS